MINHILKGISFIFHPLIMPLFGVLFYFHKSPRYFTIQIVQAKLISVFILTVLLPILLYYLLKSLGKTQSIYLKTTKERILPLALNCIVTILVLRRVLPSSEIIELYYFFVGILISTLTCLILVLIKFKASVHMVAIAGIFMFFIDLSIYYNININGTLTFLAILIGAIGTSRIHLKAHTNRELIFGFFIGLLPQLILVNYWL